MKSLGIFAAYMLALMWFPVAYAQTVSKEKKVSGRFSADRGKLVIENHYGKLDVNTWDRNEVTVDITITAKAKSEHSAQEILDRIRIIEPQEKGNSIYYKTEIGKGRTFSTKGEFRIDYVINMPRRHMAELTNKFGDIDIEDVEGKLKIDLEYGALKTGDIRGGDKVIEVGFGSAVIASMETGSVKSSYSKLSIEKAGNIQVANQFGKTTIGSIKELDIHQKYGDLDIGTVTQLKGTVQFAGLSVDKLMKSVRMDLKYCNNAKFSYVGPDVDNIDIKSSFSNQSYHFDKAASLSADMVVSFGNVKNSADNISMTESKPDRVGQTSTYKARIGSGRGSMELDVSYGNVVFR